MGSARLLTYHLPNFNLNDPELVIDPSRGEYWEDCADFRYSKVLPELQSLVGTDQIVWCVFDRSDYILLDFHVQRYVEWEYIAPEHAAVRFLRKRVWEDLIRN